MVGDAVVHAGASGTIAICTKPLAADVGENYLLFFWQSAASASSERWRSAISLNKLRRTWSLRERPTLRTCAHMCSCYRLAALAASSAIPPRKRANISTPALASAAYTA